jgi:hypothetical protein
MNESTFESMSIIQPLIPLPAHPKGRAMVYLYHLQYQYQ